MAMRITFLGTGTSHGVPRIGCDCAVCRSTDPRNQRLRAAILVTTAAQSLLVDCPPDFRTQALRAQLRHVDAVLLTHTHADHILGLDDLRVFTQAQQRAMPLYGSAASVADIRRVFAYAITEKPHWPSVPSFKLVTVAPNETMRFGEVAVEALELPHGWVNVFGFLFDGQAAYLTDCKDVPAPVIERLRGVPVLILDALRHREHPAHLTIAQARQIVERIQPRQTFFTHLCHELDHAELEAALPSNIRVAYDGLALELVDGQWQIAG